MEQAYAPGPSKPLTSTLKVESVESTLKLVLNQIILIMPDV